MDATWAMGGLPTFNDYWNAPPLQPVGMASINNTDLTNAPVQTAPSSFAGFKMGIIMVAIVAVGILLSYYIERE